MAKGRNIVGVVAGIVGLALGACGSSAPKPDDGPPPEAFASLAAEDYAAACGDAEMAVSCPTATGEDGERVSACACSAYGNMVGQGRLTLEGPDGAVEFELVQKDGAWALGARITPEP